MWELFCEIVYYDRERNADTAEQERLKQAGGASDDNGDGEEDSEAEGKELCKKKYWQITACDIRTQYEYLNMCQLYFIRNVTLKCMY